MQTPATAGLWKLPVTATEGYEGHPGTVIGAWCLGYTGASYMQRLTPHPLPQYPRPSGRHFWLEKHDNQPWQNQRGIGDSSQFTQHERVDVHVPPKKNSISGCQSMTLYVAANDFRNHKRKANNPEKQRFRRTQPDAQTRPDPNQRTPNHDGRPRRPTVKRTLASHPPRPRLRPSALIPTHIPRHFTLSCTLFPLLPGQPQGSI